MKRTLTTAIVLFLPSCGTNIPAPDCPEAIPSSITLTVTDAATGAPICDAEIDVLQNGAVLQSQQGAGDAGAASCTFLIKTHSTPGSAATYSLRVSAPGHTTTTTTTPVVDYDQCGDSANGATPLTVSLPPSP